MFSTTPPQNISSKSKQILNKKNNKTLTKAVIKAIEYPIQRDPIKSFKNCVISP